MIFFYAGAYFSKYLTHHDILKLSKDSAKALLPFTSKQAYKSLYSDLHNIVSVPLYEFKNKDIGFNPFGSALKASIVT